MLLMSVFCSKRLFQFYLGTELDRLSLVSFWLKMNNLVLKATV